MKNNGFHRCLMSAKKLLGKHSPEILVAVGIVGFISAGVHAVTQTPKAVKLLDEASKRKKEESSDETELTLLEKVKTVAPCYIPALSMATASAMCVIGGTSIKNKRLAAAATACKLSETALTEYKEQIAETFGDEKKKEIDSAINKKKLEKAPSDNSVVVVTGNGDSLFFDSVSGRYFQSSIEKVRSAVNTINRTMVYDNYISLTDFYDEIGLEPTKYSDGVGWNLDDGLVEVVFDARLDEAGKPCVVLDYRVAPRYDYSELM